jgi:hypothetical protein
MGKLPKYQTAPDDSAKHPKPFIKFFVKPAPVKYDPSVHEHKEPTLLAVASRVTTEPITTARYIGNPVVQTKPRERTVVTKRIHCEGGTKRVLVRS